MFTIHFEHNAASVIDEHTNVWKGNPRYPCSCTIHDTGSCSVDCLSFNGFGARFALIDLFGTREREINLKPLNSRL